VGQAGIPFWELRVGESSFFLDGAPYLTEDDRYAVMRSFKVHFE
jgi:hypothetical protein